MLSFHSASLVGLGEKLGGGPTDRSVDMLGTVSEALFLRSSRVYPNLLGQRERLLCIRTARGKCTCDVHGPAQEAYVSCVSGFPCRVYIDSNCRDFRI
jgi:hypothetical protein